MDKVRETALEDKFDALFLVWFEMFFEVFVNRHRSTSVSLKLELSSNIIDILG